MKGLVGSHTPPSLRLVKLPKKCMLRHSLLYSFKACEISSAAKSFFLSSKRVSENSKAETGHCNASRSHGKTGTSTNMNSLTRLRCHSNVFPNMLGARTQALTPSPRQRPWLPPVAHWACWERSLGENQNWELCSGTRKLTMIGSSSYGLPSALPLWLPANKLFRGFQRLQKYTGGYNKDKD